MIDQEAELQAFSMLLLRHLQGEHHSQPENLFPVTFTSRFSGSRCQSIFKIFYFLNVTYRTV